MVECRSHLSQIVQNQQHRFGGERAVMGKCHYLLVESDQDSKLAALPKGRHIRCPAEAQVLQSAPELYRGAAQATVRPEMVRNPAN